MDFILSVRFKSTSRRHPGMNEAEFGNEGDLYMEYQTLPVPDPAWQRAWLTTSSLRRDRVELLKGQWTESHAKLQCASSAWRACKRSDRKFPSRTQWWPANHSGVVLQRCVDWWKLWSWFNGGIVASKDSAGHHFTWKLQQTAQPVGPNRWRPRETAEWRWEHLPRAFPKAIIVDLLGKHIGDWDIVLKLIEPILRYAVGLVSVYVARSGRGENMNGSWSRNARTSCSGVLCSKPVGILLAKAVHDRRCCNWTPWISLLS